MSVVKIPINDHENQTLNRLSELLGMPNEDILSHMVASALDNQSETDLSEISETIENATQHRDVKVRPIGPIIVDDQTFDLYLTGRKSYLMVESQPIGFLSAVIIASQGTKNQQYLLRLVSYSQDNPKNHIQTLSLWTPNEYKSFVGNPDTKFIEMNFPEGPLTQKDMSNIQFKESGDCHD